MHRALPGVISDEMCGGLPTENPGEVPTAWQGEVVAHNAVWSGQGKLSSEDCQEGIFSTL